MLKACAKKVWDLIGTFKSFSIIFINREKNHKVDSFAISASMFNPNTIVNENFFQLNTLLHSIVPNNEYPWQIFDNEEKMLKKLENSKGEENKNASLNPKDKIDYFDQEGILNLKNNYFPEGLVTLKSCFMRNDAIKDENTIE